MTQLNPGKRWTVDQVLQSKWMTSGQIATQAELSQEFTARKDKVDEKIKEE